MRPSLVIVFLAAVLAVDALAEDSLDVSGGFFDKQRINQGFFEQGYVPHAVGQRLPRVPAIEVATEKQDEEETPEAVKEPEHQAPLMNEAPNEQPKGEEDSFAIDGGEPADTPASEIKEPASSSKSNTYQDRAYEVLRQVEEMNRQQNNSDFRAFDN